MNEVLHANIFFIISSVGIGILTLLACVLLYQIIRVVKVVRRIVERVEQGSEVLVEDIENLRENLDPTRIVSYIISLVPGMAPKRRARRRRDDE